MITVVARWEFSQMEAEVEWRMWRQLKGFGIKRFIFTPIFEEFNNTTIEQYDTMEECLSHVPNGNRVFLESTGKNSMNDLPSRDEDVVFILGSTTRSNVKFMKDHESFRIYEPQVTDMYPTSAAAVALAFWVGQ